MIILKLMFVNVRSDLMEKIIKNCRGVKNCHDDINRMKKELS